MRIGPLFKWYGSKWSSTRYYPKPCYTTIYEPYAGSAGYSLNYCSKNIYIEESNSELLYLWKWLIDEADQFLIRSIPTDLPIGYNILSLGMSVGQSLLLKHWQRTNNVGHCWTISPWGNKGGQWTKHTRERVSNEVYEIKHWKIGQPSEVKDITIFIDPPYMYNYQYQVHNFDWETLGKYVYILNDTCQIIACEAACPETGKIPTYLPFRNLRKVVTSRHGYSKELIYCNNSGV